MEVSFAWKINDDGIFQQAMFDCFWWEITNEKELKQPSTGWSGFSEVSHEDILWYITNSWMLYLMENPKMDDIREVSQ